LIGVCELDAGLAEDCAACKDTFDFRGAPVAGDGKRKRWVVVDQEFRDQGCDQKFFGKFK
jgi:hypothetical protein